MKKKLLSGLVLSLVVLSLTACSGGKDSDSYKIAISQYVEHPSLNAVHDGIIDALADAGIKEGENLVIDFQNAQAEPANLQPISQKIKEGNPDVAIGIATPSALGLIDEITETPVVFAAVTDPIADKLVPSLESPGGNVTGASDSSPEAIESLMDFIAKEFSTVKKVGIVINKGESNSVVMAATAQARLATHGIELIEAPIVNASDVQIAAQSLVGKVDAIFITLDNSVVEAVGTIIDVAYENDIPFFSSDRDTVEAGAFATVGFKYYDHGYQVGQMVVDILKNGKKPGEMTVTKPQNLDFIINTKVAAEMGIEVTDAMKAYVKDPANNIIQ
ncbi:ABC transporter substrate-binding protein [Paenibacillus endoradicis]|uniref:ABC transporter substrate-binding protein n=1 Tax=Paenibacillus endoradicis TaxID=2972487 RepID=UPI0021595650|nr:ABC transporter substrate-binding protein [Paenibacillus endoradicis]MCR8660721.1 ABC transporter substrate-binding protein [Paenibacillus endoradicis]